MAPLSPIYDPGKAFGGRATGAAVTSGRLVKVAAAKVDGGNVPIAHAGAGDSPIGAVQADIAQNDLGTVHANGTVLPIESGAAFAMGAALEVAANGRLITLNTGRKVAVAIQAAGAAGQFPLVQLQF